MAITDDDLNRLQGELDLSKLSTPAPRQLGLPGMVPKGAHFRDPITPLGEQLELPFKDMRQGELPFPEAERAATAAAVKSPLRRVISPVLTTAFEVPAAARDITTPGMTTGDQIGRGAESVGRLAAAEAGLGLGGALGARVGGPYGKYTGLAGAAIGSALGYASPDLLEKGANLVGIPLEFPSTTASNLRDAAAVPTRPNIDPSKLTVAQAQALQARGLLPGGDVPFSPSLSPDSLVAGADLARITGSPVPASGSTPPPNVPDSSNASATPPMDPNGSGVTLPGGRKLSYGQMVNGVPTFSNVPGQPGTISPSRLRDLGDRLNTVPSTFFTNPVDPYNGMSTEEAVAARMRANQGPKFGYTPEMAAQADMDAILSGDWRTAGGTAASNLAQEARFAPRGSERRALLDQLGAMREGAVRNYLNTVVGEEGLRKSAAQNQSLENIAALKVKGDLDTQQLVNQGALDVQKLKNRSDLAQALLSGSGGTGSGGSGKLLGTTALGSIDDAAAVVGGTNKDAVATARQQLLGLSPRDQQDVALLASTHPDIARQYLADLVQVDKDARAGERTGRSVPATIQNAAIGASALGLPQLLSKFKLGSKVGLRGRWGAALRNVGKDLAAGGPWWKRGAGYGLELIGSPAGRASVLGGAGALIGATQTPDRRETPTNRMVDFKIDPKTGKPLEAKQSFLADLGRNSVLTAVPDLFRDSRVVNSAGKSVLAPNSDTQQTTLARLANTRRAVDQLRAQQQADLQAELEARQAALQAALQGQ